MHPDWIIPDWPVPAHVSAVSTTRQGGVSLPPFDSMNPADHVGDEGLSVAANRQRLGDLLNPPSEPLWLTQVHGIQVHQITGLDQACYPRADASVALRLGPVCVIMTADCLPVLFCDRAGTRVGAAHAGWRGLQAGVLEETIRALGEEPSELLAWMGPAIGPAAFEVGDEVRDAFMAHAPQAAEAFVPGAVTGKWLADIYQLARQRLAAAGVTAVYGGGYCTFSDKERFFSYRRDGQTGRMASLIWLNRNT